MNNNRGSPRFILIVIVVPPVGKQDPLTPLLSAGCTGGRAWSTYEKTLCIGDMAHRSGMG